MQMTDIELRKKIQSHELWVESGGDKGKRFVLIGEYFDAVSMSNANLSGVDLSKSYFGLSLFFNVNFTNANLAGVNFTNAKLQNVNFTNAKLKQADFTDANLTGSNFTGANLIEAYFNRSNLTEVNFTDANLLGTSFVSTDMSFTKGIVTFSFNKHVAVFDMQGLINIDYISKTVNWWEKNYKQLGVLHNYSEQEMKVYNSFVKMCSQMMKEN